MLNLTEMNKTEKKEKKEIKSRQRIRSNREISVITYVFLALFIGLMAYLAYYTQFTSKTVINNTYNKRQALLESRLVRGDILSREGNVLATTKSDNDGGYYRLYPYRNTFSHIVGYSTHGVLGVEGMENYTLLSCDGNIVKRISNDLAGKKNHGDNGYRNHSHAVYRVRKKVGSSV